MASNPPPLSTIVCSSRAPSLLAKYFCSLTNSSEDSRTVTCGTPGCGGAAEYKIASPWSAGRFSELKTYGLACEQHYAQTYRDALRRTVDAGALAALFAQLAVAKSALSIMDAYYSVALSVLTAHEYRQNLIYDTAHDTGYFRAFLGRPASDSDIAGLLAQFDAGASDEQVIAGLLDSSEYFLRLHVYP